MAGEGKTESLFWADQIAKDIIEREDRLKRGSRVIRTESGLGASGIPHIGSIGDVLRQYAITLSLRDSGFKSELIAYSDDRDGLRKVPLGFPEDLEKYIGAPVTNIPDPFGCHKSYGDHMSSMLIDAIERLGIDYNFQSGTENYRNGVFNRQIEKILLNADRVGRIIKEMSGQEKFTQTYPYLPVCAGCGKIYTTRVYSVDHKGHKVLYECSQEFIGKDAKGKEIKIKGCGHKGEASYYNGTGKVAWKAEFAIRWDALQIMFEALGKDILNSVKINDRICREVLGWEPPLHAVYELFLEKGGKKISKSIGNVFTPQDWLRYGSPESLRLLMFKRFTGTRELSPEDIPAYNDEVDYLSGVYFGYLKVGNEKELKHLKRLFQFVHFMKVPKSRGISISYNTVVNILNTLPRIPNKLEVMKDILTNQGHIEKLSKEEEEGLKRRITYAENWIDAMQPKGGVRIELGKKEREALSSLVDKIEKAMSDDELQQSVYETAKEHDIKMGAFFKLLYNILLGLDSGPKAGRLIRLIGKETSIRVIKEKLQ